MKLHIKTPHESTMCPIDFMGQKVKGQWHNALISWTCFAHICFPFIANIMKLHIKTLFELRVISIDFGVILSKVKVTIN